MLSYGEGGQTEEQAQSMEDSEVGELGKVVTPSHGNENGEAPSGDEVAGGSQATPYPSRAITFLMISTTFQSFAGSGLQAVLELYFSLFLFPHTLRSLSKKRTDKLSTTSMNLWVGLQQVVALSAGYLADKKWGNYKTQIVSNIVSAVGGGLLIVATWHLGLSAVSGGGSHVTSDPSQLEALTPPGNSSLWRSVDMAGSFVGLALIAIGYGQAQTIQSVFVGNQFSADQREAKKKSFSWYYLFCNVGSLGGEFGAPVLRQSFKFFYCICAVAGSFILSSVVFVAGHAAYKRSDVGSEIASAQQSTRTGVQEERMSPDQEEDNPDSQTEVTALLKSTESISVPGAISSSRMLTWRDMLKEIKPLLGVFVPLIAFWALFFQQNSTWVLQGQEMNCFLGKLKVPPDAMPSFNDCLVILFIPLLDFVVYPHLETALGIVATPIRRIGAGMFCTMCSFALAGLLQLYISSADEQRGNDDSTDCHGNVSLAWQVPQYILISFAEVLVAVTGLEFAYSQAPDRLRNVVTSLWFLSQAFGTLLVAVLAELPIPIRWQYFVYTILMCLLLLAYIVINRRFVYKQGTVM